MPMTRGFRSNLVSVLGVLAIGGAFAGVAWAQGLHGADAVRARQEGLKATGAAFKTINDQLKGSNPDIAAIRGAANRIVVTANAMPGWFPADSAPSAVQGVRTKARPEIWSDSARFAQAMAGFRAQAPRLKAAADSGNIGQVRTQFAATGAACRTCHEPFRAQ
jgi:cytochrome c556